MRILILLLSVALSSPALATPADDLNQFVEGVHSLSAAFKQVQKDEKGKTLSTSSGRMWLSRPGKFRWAYEKPYSQLMVCDGQKLWMYDPDLNQVTVRDASEALPGTPASLLTQKMTLSEAFTLEDGGSKGALRVVRLTPKSNDSDFKSIELSLRDGVPQQMKFHDQLGGTSTVSFSNIIANGVIADDLLRFKVPKGAEVVEAGEAK